MNLKSKWICVGLSVFLLKPWTSEAVIRTVTTSNDGDPGSLRDVILTQAMAGDEIDFTNTLNGSTIFLTNRIPIPNVNFVINGPGPENLTISGNNSNQIFTLINGANISINGLTIANGSNIIGGAINNPLGSSLTLSNCLFKDNQAVGDGGTVFNSGTLTIWNCIFSNNWASGAGSSGGGVYNNNILDIHYSTFLTNRAAGGGAVRNGGTGFIETSTFVSNTATGYGGGIRNDKVLTIVNSTLFGNRANGAGAGGGGGIMNFSNLAIIGCTIVSNSSGNGGGGIDNTPVFGTSPITLTNTIIAGNIAAGSPNIKGIVTNTEYNFIGSTNGASGFSASDIVGSIASPKNPLLGNLGNYGGFTETTLPLLGSPVIGAGTNFGGFLAIDQRGFLRGVTTITIGAVEAVYSLTASPGSTPQTAQTNTIYPGQLSVLLTESAINLISGVNVSYQAPAAGPSGTFPGEAIATNILTINGFGGPGVFTANAIPGSFNVTATVTGLPPISFVLSNSITASLPIGGGTNSPYNSGDFTDDGFTDVLAFKGGKNGGLSLLDIKNNTLEGVQKLAIPDKGKLMAGNRVGMTNYLAYKTRKNVTINAYRVSSNGVNLLNTLFNASLPKPIGTVRASGDVNGDGILDLIGVKGKNVQAVLGPGYSGGTTISNLLSNKKLPGKVVGMYSVNGTNWVLVFQKGKSASSYVIGANLAAVAGPTVSANGKILGMSGATPITQKGKTITAGSFTFNNSKTNNLGKTTGPK